MEADAQPALALGELYTDGRLIVTKGDLYQLLELAPAISPNWRARSWGKALNKAHMAFRGLHQRNDRRSARRNIASITT